MLEEVLGAERPFLHQPLVRRVSGGLAESPDEMAGRDAAGLAKFVDGRRVAHSREQNFLGDALLPWREAASAALDRRRVRVISDQMRHQQNRDLIDEKL